MDGIGTESARRSVTAVSTLDRLVLVLSPEEWCSSENTPESVFLDVSYFESTSSIGLIRSGVGTGEAMSELEENENLNNSFFTWIFFRRNEFAG